MALNAEQTEIRDLMVRREEARRTKGKAQAVRDAKISAARAIYNAGRTAANSKYEADTAGASACLIEITSKLEGRTKLNAEKESNAETHQ